MGSEVALADAPVLRVEVPSLRHLDPALRPPELRVRILHARADGWSEVASGPTFTPGEPGAYRAQIDLVPWHVAHELGELADELTRQPTPWIYSNAIYVR